MRNLQQWTILLMSAGALALPAVANAGSFQLNEQSASSLGRANAGDASANLDASAVFYNPALLTALSKGDFLVGATDYKIRGEFSKTSATDAAGQPLTGDNGGDMGDHNRLGAGVTPILSFATPIARHTVFGVALETPFGLTTGYDGTSVLRYQAQYTSISVNNINPTIAYQVSNDFSIGFGLDVAKAEAKLTNQIDYGAVCYANVNPLACNAAGLYPQSHDGFYKVAGSDWGYGWNAGVAWRHDGTSIGLTYRSRLFFNINGNVEFKNVPTLFQASKAFADAGAQAKLNLPDTVDLSATQAIGSAWKVSATVRYVRWSTFHSLIIRYDSPNTQGSSTQTFDYRNTWFVGLGADYRLSSSWTLHGGVAYDQSPVRDQYREPRLPDTNRRWVAFGATWTLAPSSSVSVGWAHLFMNDHSPMNNTGPSGSTVKGQWSTNADLFSLQYQYSF